MIEWKEGECLWGDREPHVGDLERDSEAEVFIARVSMWRGDGGAIHRPCSCGLSRSYIETGVSVSWSGFIIRRISG